LKPHLKEQWCIPPEANAEFVCCMEDVLDVYHRPYDEKRPLVCLEGLSQSRRTVADSFTSGRNSTKRAATQNRL
jgi:hypothetical protein